MLKKKINQHHQQDNQIFMFEIFNRDKFILIVGILISCGNITQKKEMDKISEKSASEITKVSVTQTETALKGYNKVFVYEDDNVKQTLGINYKSKYRIEFALDFEKKDGSCKVILNGEAINKNKDFDPELDEDEDGIAYPSNEFLYEKGECIIALRIAMKEKDKAIIKSTGCNQQCLTETTEILRIKKPR